MWRKRKHVSMIVEDEAVEEEPPVPVESAEISEEDLDLNVVTVTEGEDGQKQVKVEIPEVVEKVVPATKPGQRTRVVKTRLERTNALPINRRLKVMENMFRAVFFGSLYSVMIRSGPGIGKSHAVMEIVKELGLKEDVDYIHIKGSVSAYGLYKLVCHWSEIAEQRKEDAKKKNGKTEQGANGKAKAKPTVPVMVLDDVTVTGPQGKEILKGLADSYPVRTINWLTDRASMDPEEVKSKGKLPHKVNYTGGVIILTNEPVKKLDKPLIDRSIFLELEVPDAEMMERMRTIASGPKFQPDMDPKLKLKVLDWMCSDQYQGSERSMRTLVKACQLAQAEPKNWQDLVQIV